MSKLTKREKRAKRREWYLEQRDNHQRPKGVNTFRRHSAAAVSGSQWDYLTVVMDAWRAGDETARQRAVRECDRHGVHVPPRYRESKPSHYRDRGDVSGQGHGHSERVRELHAQRSRMLAFLGNEKSTSYEQEDEDRKVRAALRANGRALRSLGEHVPYEGMRAR